MQESLEEGDTEITFNNINFEESLLNKMLVDLHIIQLKKSQDIVILLNFL
jgi:hypothetical protein